MLSFSRCSCCCDHLFQFLIKMKSSHGWSLLVTMAAVLFYLIPSPIDPAPFQFPEDAPHLAGPLTVNKILQETEKLFEGKLVGPESFASDSQGFIYTGTSDGKLWKFKGTELHLVAHTGINSSECGQRHMESRCGRPKGLKVSRAGDLIVADSYKGLLRVNTQTGDVTTLLTGINGKKFQFLNGLDISSDEKAYFTDSSTKWTRRDHRYEVIEANALGRVLEYDLHTGQHRVLLDGLYLANGIALSKNEDFLTVAEMSVARLTKYYLKGPKAGQREIVNQNLPGYPDNIRRTGSGTFYVGIGSTRFAKPLGLKPFLDLMAPYPSLKKLVAKVTPLWAYDLFLSKHGLVVEVDDMGTIINSFHDPEGKVIQATSEAYLHGSDVYIGHYAAPYVGKLRLRKLQ